MKLIIRLLTALSLALALLWGAIFTATSDRATSFFELAHRKAKEYGIIEKTKEKLARTLNQVDRPVPEPVITDEIIEEDLPEIKPRSELKTQTPMPEIETKIDEPELPEYDQVEMELLSEEADDFSLVEQNDALTASDAIRILETLNIERQ